MYDVTFNPTDMDIKDTSVQASFSRNKNKLFNLWGSELVISSCIKISRRSFYTRKMHTKSSDGFGDFWICSLTGETAKIFQTQSTSEDYFLQVNWKSSDN